MKILSLSEAKMKLSTLVDSVNKSSNEIMITKNGKPAAILVSPDEFDSLKESIAILSDPDFMKDLKKGLQELKAGKGKTYSVDELDDLLD